MWEHEWGGQLRCHVDADLDDHIGGKPNGEVMDVEPRGGTLVVFKSRLLLHEVLPAHRRRFAITQWNMKVAQPSASSPSSLSTTPHGGAGLTVHTWSATP